MDGKARTITTAMTMPMIPPALNPFLVLVCSWLRDDCVGPVYGFSDGKVMIGPSGPVTFDVDVVPPGPTGPVVPFPLGGEGGEIIGGVGPMEGVCIVVATPGVLRSVVSKTGWFTQT